MDEPQNHTTSTPRPPLSAKELECNELDRKGYDTVASEQGALLDKSIISISGASFSIAMGFIDKLIPLETAYARWVLWTSLLILASVIIVTVLSFWAGKNSARYKRSLCDKAEIENDMSIRFKKNPWATYVSFFNNARLVLFILGMGLLAGFIFYNGVANPNVAQRKQQELKYDRPEPPPANSPQSSLKTSFPAFSSTESAAGAGARTWSRLSRPEGG